MPRARQQARRLLPADAHEGHVEPVEEGHGAMHELVGQQHVASFPRAHAAGRRQERALAVEQVRQAAHEMGGVAFRGRVPAASEDLDHARVAHATDRVHRLHHRQQRGAPGADADDISGANRGFEMEGRCGAQLAHGSRVIVARDLHDLGLCQAVARLQLLLQLRLRPTGGAHGDAHDALLLRLPQQSRDLGLGQAQASGDLRLLEAHLVVEPRDTGHQTQLVSARHVSLLPARARRRRYRRR